MPGRGTPTAQIEGSERHFVYASRRETGKANYGKMRQCDQANLEQNVPTACRRPVDINLMSLHGEICCFVCLVPCLRFIPGVYLERDAGPRQLPVANQSRYDWMLQLWEGAREATLPR